MSEVFIVLISSLFVFYMVWVLKNWVTQLCDSPLDAFLGGCEEEDISWQIDPGHPWEHDLEWK